MGLNVKVSKRQESREELERKIEDLLPSREEREDDVLGKAYDPKLVRRLGHYFRPYRRQVWAAVLLMTVASLLSVAGPWVVGRAIDDGIRQGSLSVLRLWTESYATALIDPDGPWGDFARQTVDDWLALLARAQPSGVRRSSAAVTQRTAILAVLRGGLLDLLATGQRARVTRGVLAGIEALTGA